MATKPIEIGLPSAPLHSYETHNDKNHINNLSGVRSMYVSATEYSLLWDKGPPSLQVLAHARRNFVQLSFEMMSRTNPTTC
jgi:hypothetical protein